MGEAFRLNVLTVDDEPPARERLRGLLAEIGDVEVIGEAAKAQRRSATPTTSRPMWCCSMCACPAWTGSRRRGT
jgi:hypothetical protein